MLTYDDALNMNYYKKTDFTGWMGGMRFRIMMDQKPVPEVPEGETPPEPEPPFFHTYAWPGPYNFPSTPAEKKVEATFPFDEDGRKAAVDWVNAQYENGDWPKSKMNLEIL